MPAKINYELAGTALVDALYGSDEEAARKHGVSVRSIRRWRRRLDPESADHDPELASFVRLKKEKVEADWVDEVGGAIRAAIAFVGRAAKAADEKDPEAVHAITGAFKILTEMQIARRVIDERLAGED